LAIIADLFYYKVVWWRNGLKANRKRPPDRLQRRVGIGFGLCKATHNRFAFAADVWYNLVNENTSIERFEDGQESWGVSNVTQCFRTDMGTEREGDGASSPA